MRYFVLGSIIPVLAYSTTQCASVATHAGMVTLLVPDLLPPDVFSFFIPAYLAFLYAAVCLALSNDMGKTNYWHLTGTLMALPALNAIHDNLLHMLTGPLLRCYLVFVTGFTLTLFALILTGRKPKTASKSTDAANPSVL
jgi:hypothetical protein